MVTAHNRLAQPRLDVAGVGLAGQQPVHFVHRLVGGQFEEKPHHVVGDGHHLAEDFVRRLVDADVVAQALGHLFHAVQSRQDGQRQGDLRLHALVALQVAPDQQIELLVRPADLHVGPHHHRVVALHERIQELVYADGGLLFVAVLEIVAFQHPRHRHLGRQPHHVREAHQAEPVAVAHDLQPLHVQDLAGLFEIRLRIGQHLFVGELGAGLALAGRVADHAGVVADDQHGLVSQVLEHAQLSQRHGVAQVKIGDGRVHAQLDAQRFAGLRGPVELLRQFLLRENLDHAAPNHGQLLFDALECHLSPRSRLKNPGRL